jgi:hypothetical protein
VNSLYPRVHLTATCKSCEASTEITATDLEGKERVLCGVCETLLGTVAQLRDAALALTSPEPVDAKVAGIERPHVSLV